jgi:NAD(P)-dependent dehydrogenase (short-subunit alcohol dehydrogenase family)
MAIAFVTGTSSGIGLAAAVTLARAGHTVIATMRNVDKVGELQTIVTAEKLPVTVASLNVDDDTSVSTAIGAVLKDTGTSTFSSTMLVWLVEDQSRKLRWRSSDR